MRKRLFVFVIVLAIVLAVSALAVVSYTAHYPFRRNLSLTLVDQSDSGLPEFDYLANITDSGVDTGGFIYLRVEPERSPGQHPMYLEIQNPKNTELDSITLTFDSHQIVFVYFQSHYEVTYSYSFVNNDCDVAVIEVDGNSGAASGGSVFQFNLHMQNVEADFDMKLTVDLSMHNDTPFQLTQLHAVAAVDVGLHQEN